MDKPIFSIKFWYNFLLVISTTYVIITYVFTPPNNQCQMTFMMEPPKFIPIPINIAHNSDANLKYPQLSIKGAVKNHKTSRYTLFMYSEFGFPQSSDIARDLRDSMPVLFVPGNAGSYQQVRSLASTSIRHQLQSLEASKFVFYTIDFNDELSAISGKLIENQTLFVEKALKQIIKLHSAETNGVILIGHSVGGFISKVLLTLPNFDPKTVPLLISLASPLVKPHIMFDNKMYEIYNRTNQFWSQQKTKPLNTIAMSISGGRSDRLVPTHLSMDPHYDLSITTTSIKDVWLTTDHVCITWCRELMQKLATLMSSLMNKKKTRLIDDKNEALSIIRKELLLIQEINYDKKKPPVIHKNWKSMRPFVLVEYNDFYFATRIQLGESIILINRTTTIDYDLLIYIDHIQSSKGNGVFGCKDFTISDLGQMHCAEKVDLMYLATPIPSRKYETKKTSIRLLKSDNNNNYNFLMIDFIGHSSSYSDNKIPDFLTIQKLDSIHEQKIRIPTIYEVILKKYLLFKTIEYEIKIEHKNIPIIFRKFKITNLNYQSQVYSLIYESQNCSGLDGQSRGSTIILYQNNYMQESFHPARNDPTMSVNVKLNHQKNLLIKDKNMKNQDQNHHLLELYIDGTCSAHRLRIEFSVYDLIVNFIQNNLSLILTMTCYFSITKVCNEAFNQYEIYYKELNNLYKVTKNITNISKPIFLWLIIDYSTNILDKPTNLLIIYLLAEGMICFSDHFIKRIVDLGTIIHKIQSLLIQKNQEIGHSNRLGSKINGQSKTIVTNEKNSRGSYVNKFLRYFVISSGILLSTAIISIYTVLILIKTDIKIQEMLNKLKQVPNKSANCCTSSNNKHFRPDTVENNDCDDAKKNKLIMLNSTNNLLFSVTVISVIAMICNVPSSLIQLNYIGFITNSYQQIFYQLLIENSGQLPISIMTLICIERLIEKLDFNYRSYQDKSFLKRSSHTTNSNNSYMLDTSIVLGPLLFLTDILTLNTHFCQMMLVKVIIWLLIFQSKIEKQVIMYAEKEEVNESSDNNKL